MNTPPSVGRFNIVSRIAKMIKRAQRQQFFRAKVITFTGQKVKIERYGHTGTPDNQFYPILESYFNDTPAANDEVLCLSFGSGVIVIGRILR